MTKTNWMHATELPRKHHPLQLTVKYVNLIVINSLYYSNYLYAQQLLVVEDKWNLSCDYSNNM